jgi:molybdopterin-guanine dinucleotide biosynthesis protein
LIQAGRSTSSISGSSSNTYVNTYFKVDRFGTIITKTGNHKPHFIALDANNNEAFKVENNGTLTVNNKININNASNAAPLTIKANNGNKILQLENSGLLRARRIKVDTDNWADYVFVNGYKLLPLQKVAVFIKKYGHLPNMPSAKYLKTHGIDINQMLNLQMEKIEELTLYTIEQENKINQLTNKVEKLEQEMAEIKKILTNK